MIFEHSKEGLIQSLQNNLTKTYKRKRLKLTTNETSATQNVKDDDMDIEGSDEESSNSPAVMFPQPRPDTDETNSNTVTDVEQEELLELERRQEELRRALEDADDGSSDSGSISNQNGDADDKSNESKNVSVANDESPESPDDNQSNNQLFEESIIVTETSIRMEETELSVPSTPTMSGQSRESVFGTPLIKQVSRYTQLPVGEKWSVGVTDVIDFENLPDATGTYQKLTGVIKKVRQVIKQINDDPENDS